MDMYKYKNINNPKARNTVLSLIELHSLLNVYRQYHPQTKCYSWHKRNLIKQARLEFFLVTSNMCDIVTKCDIKPSYRSDHSILEIGLLLNNFSLGKGIWKFNNSLLELPQYISLIHKVVEDELIKYSIPVYSLD